MKYGMALFCMLFSALALADKFAPVAVFNQKLSAVDYAVEGQQTGCGLRATGETKDALSLNVLVTVFRKKTGATFGVIKVVARKALMKDGAPVLEDGRIVMANLGKIESAWIRTDSGKQPAIDKSAESSHADAYMVDTEFTGTIDLLTAMSQEYFKVGINRGEAGPDEIFQFDTRIGQEEAGKFSACMANLRAVLQVGKSRETF